MKWEQLNWKNAMNSRVVVNCDLKPMKYHTDEETILRTILSECVDTMLFSARRFTQKGFACEELTQTAQRARKVLHDENT